MGHTMHFRGPTYMDFDVHINGALHIFARPWIFILERIQVPCSHCVLQLHVLMRYVFHTRTWSGIMATLVIWLSLGAPGVWSRELNDNCLNISGYTGFPMCVRLTVGIWFPYGNLFYLTYILTYQTGSSISIGLIFVFWHIIDLWRYGIKVIIFP